jgi:hypothetical protein
MTSPIASRHDLQHARTLLKQALHRDSTQRGGCPTARQEICINFIGCEWVGRNEVQISVEERQGMS